MRPPAQQFTAIVDLQGFGMSNMDSNLAKLAAHMLQSYYPERCVVLSSGGGGLFPPSPFKPGFFARRLPFRLSVLLVVNCGVVLNVFWRMVKPLLEERTRKKVNFIKNPKDLAKLEDLFDLATLPLNYGGSLPNPWWIGCSELTCLPPTGHSELTLPPSSYGLEFLSRQSN